MANPLKVLSVQLKEIWRHFGTAQKVSTISALVVTLVVMGLLLAWSARPDYRLLYSGLSMKDAATIREKLDDEKIKVVLKDSGRSIFVPASDLYRTRLMLASQGLPKEGGAGFELFEQPKFGLTDFAQQINYQRALQGEIERTIAAMNGIDSARVLLVLPKERLFASEEEKKASASILVNLSGGHDLSQSQIRSIVQLAAGSVPGLAPSAVTLTDQNGRLLTRGAGNPDEPAEQAGEQLAAQERAEMQLTRKAQDMLDKALGEGRSIVRVSLTLDYSKIERRSETYDPENRVVRAETIQSESSSSPGQGHGGVAGVVANIPVGSPGSGTIEQGLSKSKKENVRTEYAVPSDVQHVVEQGARIARMSVSVCVAKGAEARTEEELAKINQMVRNAVGFVDDGSRSDSIDVTEMEFPDVKIQTADWWYTLPIDSIAKTVIAVVALLAVYIVSRRLMSSGVVRQEMVGVPIQELTGEGLDAPGLAHAEEHQGSLAPQETNLEEVTRIAEQNPKAVAAWITSIMAGR